MHRKWVFDAQLRIYRLSRAVYKSTLKFPILLCTCYELFNKEAVKSVLRIFSEHNKVCYFRLDRYYFKSIKPMTITYK